MKSISLNLHNIPEKAFEEWEKEAKEMGVIFWDASPIPQLEPLLLTRYTLDLMDETKFLSEKLWNKSLENGTTD